jgi:hypothetical protein
MKIFTLKGSYDQCKHTNEYGYSSLYKYIHQKRPGIDEISSKRGGGYNHRAFQKNDRQVL